MALEWSHGLMGLSMRETILMERRRERENLLLLMEATMKENSNKMKFVGMENITGQMENNMMVNGAITKCMDMGL